MIYNPFRIASIDVSIEIMYNLYNLWDGDANDFFRATVCLR